MSTMDAGPSGYDTLRSESPVELEVKSLNTKDLATWLSTMVDVEDYGEDIEKLQEEKINGRTFLTLPDNQSVLGRLGLSIGAEEVFKSIAHAQLQSLKETSSGSSIDVASDDQDSEATPPSPDMDVQYALWCSTDLDTFSPIEMDPQTPEEERMELQSGFVLPDTNWPWKDYRELRVKFMSPVPSHWTVGHGAQMNKENILAWANTWSLKGDGQLPRFVEAKPGEDAQIRIQFNCNRKCNSVLGMRAKNVSADTPTMNLDLYQGGKIPDDFKRHLVIHEFGHALGLGHEHQRSNFWTSIRPFVNVKKMKKDLHVSDYTFELDWGEIVSSESGSHTQYDPGSIMHYWFMIDWLNKPYRDKKNIERDIKNTKLTAAQAEALLGVHCRHGKVANEPSSLDLKLLKEIYGGSAMSTGAPPSASLSPVVLTVEDGGRVMTDTDLTQLHATTNRLRIEDLSAVKNELWPIRTCWKKIGEGLGIHPTSLDSMAITKRDDPDACFSEVVATWLRMSSTPEHPITWYALVSALQQNQLKEACGAVVEEISRKYLLGGL